MPLTHVGRWEQTQKQIVPTTPEEAAKRDGRSLGRWESPYICMLCQQKVLFIYGKRIPHFKHSSKETEKVCAERSKYYQEFTSRNAHNAETGLLPIRLYHEGSTFTVEVGFLPLPDVALERAEAHGVKARSSCNGELGRACYNVGRSRFSSEETVYYPASKIGGEYRIHLAGADTFSEDFNIWLRAHNSITETGTVFDGEYGRRLPDHGDALIGNAYKLLLHRSAPSPQKGMDVSTELLCEQGEWRLYRIMAQKLTPESALFFLRFGLVLREQMSSAVPLWPPMWEGEHTLDTSSSTLYFLINERARLTCEGLGNTEQSLGRVTTVYHDSGETLLRLVRDNASMEMLRYYYIRGEHRCEPPRPPRIQVWQMDGAPIEAGMCKELPPDMRLRLLCQFDGRVTRSYGQVLSYVAPIRAGLFLKVDTPRLGETLQIYQGMDCCFSLELGTQKGAPLQKNLTVINGGREIPITRRAGTLLRYLGKDSQSARILADAVRRGSISKIMLAQIATQARRGTHNER